MFRSDARRLGFQPGRGHEGGRCAAVLTLYERDGAFQVYVNDMFPDGIGAAQLAFEQLKAKLDKEGLFARGAQKTAARVSRNASALSPARPARHCRTFAMSSVGAGPRCVCCSAPVNVQGFEAAAGDCRCHYPSWTKAGWVDEIIVARGGGSREDLWVFNAEVIARAAYRCKTPAHQRHWSRDRLYDPGLCGRPARAHALGGGRACCAGPCRTGTKIMHIWKKIFTIVCNLQLSLCYNKLEQTEQLLSRAGVQAALEEACLPSLDTLAGRLQIASQR